MLFIDTVIIKQPICWICCNSNKLNAFLKFSEYDILNNAGKVSHAVAEALATKEYEKFRKIQDANYVSDFDREIERLEKKLEKKED